MEAKTIEIGGQRRVIEKFSGRKVAVALKVIEHLAITYEGVQDDMADFRREYGMKRPVRLTRDQVAMHIAELQTAIGQAKTDKETPEEVTATTVQVLQDTIDSYQRLLDGPLATKESVERPGTPSQDEMFMHVVSKGFDKAEDEFVQLLGLALMTNRDVGQARKAGTIQSSMQETGDEAMDIGDIDELIAAAHAAAEMLLGDLAERKAKLGKIGALFRPAEEESLETETPSEEESTLTNGKPTGSTDSPMPTDGPPTTASMESPTPSGVAS